MAKKVIFGEEMQRDVLTGIRVVSDAVASTLGPSGRTVMLQEPFGNVTITKDGVSVAKAISLESKEEDLGAQLIKQIASKTNDAVGDGTTTSTVLARALVEEGLKTTSTGVNPIDVRNGIRMAVDDVVENIKACAHTVGPKDEIAQIASISSNDDRFIGGLIADAIEAVGGDGLITVNESATTETYVNTVEGMEFDKGSISPYFCNTENMTTEYEKPLILLSDSVISNPQDLLKPMQIAQGKGKPLFIIADNVEGEALTALVVNNIRGTVKSCAVKAPGFGDRKKLLLKDIEALTGAKLIDSDLGMNLAFFDDTYFGTCDKIVSTETTTTIVGTGASQDVLDARIASIKIDIENATSDYDREKQQERLARLSGGVAVLYVGAKTETELKEKKHRIEDAVCATRAAIESGIIAGGGTTYCKIARKLSGNLPENLKDGERIGYNIVLKAIEKPIRQIADNAGLDGAVIASKCKEADDEVGFDALNQKWGNMFEMGIIDPAKVAISALENASSIASLVLTSNCMVTIIPDDDPKNK